MDALNTIERVAAKIAPGRLHSFAEAHVVKALEEIDIQQPVGRMKLSKDLHLGEGEARTLIKHLKIEGLIDVSRSGIALSNAGKKLLSSLRSYISKELDVPSTPLTVASFNVAIRVTGTKDSVKYGLEQRDAAILAGAKGATTLVFTQNRLTLAGTHEDISKSDPLLLVKLLKLSLKEGDVLVIGSGEEKIRAELGAMVAALELLKSKKRADAR